MAVGVITMLAGIAAGGGSASAAQAGPHAAGSHSPVTSRERRAADHRAADLVSLPRFLLLSRYAIAAGRHEGTPATRSGSCVKTERPDAGAQREPDWRMVRDTGQRATTWGA